MNKIITTFLAAISIVASPAALAITIGGVDFGPLGEDPSRTHLESATLAQTIVNGNGQSASAYGFITSVNGDNTYCAAGSANCGLYYVAQFTGSQNFDAGTSAASGYVEFTATTVSIYFSNAPHNNLFDQNSPTNIAHDTGNERGHPLGDTAWP